MFGRRRGVIGVAAILVAALVLIAGTSAGAEQAATSVPVHVEITAAQSGDTVIYSITVVNHSAEAVGDVFVAGSVPKGATFVRSVATPEGSWFRGFEAVGTDVQSVVWLSNGVAGKSQQGPFSYELKVDGDSAQALAWVHWRSPSDGVAMTNPLRVAVGYVGSEACGKCHSGIYNDFRVSGHPWKLRPTEEAKGNPLPLPAGVTWDDVSYVIGGYKWKARYMNKEGYIITSADGKPGKNQYNLATGQWVDYEAGKEKKYDCGSCHTTGYSKDGNQGGMPGVVGTWALPGIQCEACHGPGAKHVAQGGNKAAIKVDRSATLCGNCHVRGTPDKIPAANGFIEHREQYNELLAGPHKAVSCVSCHNPHKKSEFSIKTECATCHSGTQQAFAGSTHQKVGATCTDCHMPAAGKSAIAVSKNEADVRTHLFRINTDPKASMFTEDGKFAKDFVTLNFACLQCHQDKSVEWAARYAKEAHTLGK